MPKVFDFGNLPDDWSECALADITPPDRPIVYGIVQAGPHCPGGVPYIRSTDVGDELDVNSLLRTSPAIAAKYRRAEVRPGDLVFSLRGNIGEMSIVPATLPVANLTQGTARIATNGSVSTTFVRYALSSNAVVSGIAAVAKGSTIREISIDQLRKVRIPIPPPETQKGIVSVLSHWDGGIWQLADLIAAKIRFKQGLMQQLLIGKVNVRRISTTICNRPVSVPVHDYGLTATAIEIQRGLVGPSYDEGLPALPDTPDRWQRVRISELLSPIQRPIRIQAASDYQLVTAKRYRGGIVARERLRGDQIKTPSQFVIRTGDFLISRRQIVHGACGLVPACLDGAIVSNEYSCLKASEYLDPRFFEYLTHTKYLQRTFYQSSVGVTVEKMIFRLDQWLRYEVNLPPMDQQRAIVAILSALDREIVLLDRLQSRLTEQKKGLMQLLLTGKASLPETARETAHA